MKYLFLISLFIYSIFYTNISYSLDYERGQIIQDSFQVSKKFKIDLPPGEWTLIQRNRWNYYGLRAKSNIIVRTENNKVIEGMILEEMHTAGVYEYIINNALNKIVFKGKYDGCYEKPEYYYLNFYRKGTTHNCFRAGHTNFYKRIYEPKDPELSNAYSQTKKWFSENFIEVPKIGLWSNHSYFSRLNYGKWFVLSYFADPSILDAPKNNFFTEESSEYHKNRIQNYPKHKRIMKKWMITSAERHRNFEQSVNALERHYLNLNEFALLDMQSDNNKEKSNDIVLEIQKLNEMYKSGIITQKEFEKAKKKILE